MCRQHVGFNNVEQCCTRRATPEFNQVWKKISSKNERGFYPLSEYALLLRLMIIKSDVIIYVAVSL